MGIDQLALHSVQLGYLKILQMGNTDPKDTKAGKEIRGQASVRRVIKNSKSCNVNAMKCMRLTRKSEIKTSVSTGKSSQVEPLYPHSKSTEEIIDFPRQGTIQPAQFCPSLVTHTQQAIPGS
ncbi:cyclase-associated protein 1 [Dorcoceras hygrometricum]|uniref:Cyclase-associated protein 1 n=1 Tax=Dorcoceras hygrometricum TaxID=472368 RepID=A0A2Z7A2N6_9LAMI|nr:cyclase-associated protein 1 [Dorcoceras hygrometricum]